MTGGSEMGLVVDAASMVGTADAGTAAAADAALPALLRAADPLKLASRGVGVEL